MVTDRVDPGRNGPVLAETLRRLMDDSAELDRMAGAARRIGTTKAAATIAELVLEMTNE